VAAAKRAIDLDATLLRDLAALVELTAPGDPDSPLRWTCLSARTLAVALDTLGHRVSHPVVAELLHGLGNSLQGNVKTCEGRQHVDRDAQFRYIARRVRGAQRQQQPTISVDTKKKELVGAFKNAGRTWRPAKTIRTPRPVGTQPRPVPWRGHRHRCAVGDGIPQAPSVSRRLELHDPSHLAESTIVSNCLTGPNEP
jgi:hypothetical protein